MFSPLLQGFVTGASLIMPIGAQNAYVLEKGMRRERHLMVAFLCALCDIGLILLGVMGGGRYLAANPVVQTLLLWGGAIFLCWYGIRALRQAMDSGAEQVAQGDVVVAEPLVPFSGLTLTVAATLAITLLNPHVYLDTIMILGAISSQLPAQQQWWFALGAMIASCVWFYGLALLAARCAPILTRPKVRRLIDALVGTIMLLIAASLIWKPVMGFLLPIHG